MKRLHAGCPGAYTEKVAEAAAANQDFVMGFICQSPAKWASAVPPGNVQSACFLLEDMCQGLDCGN